MLDSTLSPSRRLWIFGLWYSGTRYGYATYRVQVLIHQAFPDSDRQSREAFCFISVYELWVAIANIFVIFREKSKRLRNHQGPRGGKCMQKSARAGKGCSCAVCTFARGAFLLRCAFVIIVLCVLFLLLYFNTYCTFAMGVLQLCMCSCTNVLLHLLYSCS